MSEKPPSDDCAQAAHSPTEGRRRSFELALFISGGGKGSHLLFMLTSLLIGATPGSQRGRIWEWKPLWTEDPSGGKRQKSDGWGRLCFGSTRLPTLDVAGCALAWLPHSLSRLELPSAGLRPTARDGSGGGVTSVLLRQCVTPLCHTYAA